MRFQLRVSGWSALVQILEKLPAKDRYVRTGGEQESFDRPRQRELYEFTLGGEYGGRQENRYTVVLTVYLFTCERMYFLLVCQGISYRQPRSPACR
jgi:hypothetical protein